MVGASGEPFPGAHCAGRRLPGLPGDMAAARGTLDGAGQVGSEASGQGQASLGREKRLVVSRPNELPLSCGSGRVWVCSSQAQNGPFCTLWAAPPSVEGGCGEHGSQDQCNGQD